MPLVSHTFVQGSYAFAIFSARALRNWAWLRTHMDVTTLTRFVKNYNIGSLLALCGSTIHVPYLQALFPACC